MKKTLLYLALLSICVGCSIHYDYRHTGPTVVTNSVLIQVDVSTNGTVITP